MVTAVVGRKGGSAKSTTALHLAAAFSDLGRTALIELDAENASLIEYGQGRSLPFLVTDGPTWDEQHAQERWDHIVVDGYARPNNRQLQGLARLSDLLVIPTPPDALSLRVLARFLPTVAETGGRFRVLLTMVPPFPSREGERAKRDLASGGMRLAHNLEG